MARAKPTRPRCPGCGYDIFGIRDMRCPECGRTLDVRDFGLDGEPTRGDAQRYERNSALGGLIACGLIGVPLLFVLLMLSVMPRVGMPARPTIYLLIMAIVLIAWFVVVVKSAGGNLLSWRRSWKKDRRS